MQTGTVKTKRGIDPAKLGNKDIAVSGLDTAKAGLREKIGARPAPAGAPVGGSGSADMDGHDDLWRNGDDVGRGVPRDGKEGRAYSPKTHGRDCKTPCVPLRPDIPAAAKVRALAGVLRIYPRRFHGPRPPANAGGLRGRLRAARCEKKAQRSGAHRQ